MAWLLLACELALFAGLDDFGAGFAFKHVGAVIARTVWPISSVDLPKDLTFAVVDGALESQRLFLSILLRVQHLLQMHNLPIHFRHYFLVLSLQCGALVDKVLIITVQLSNHLNTPHIVEGQHVINHISISKQLAEGFVFLVSLEYLVPHQTTA